jgi:RHS repeat-associated protein
LTAVTQYPGGTAANLTTTYQYDWRDRQTDVRSPANVVTHYELDNLGRITSTTTYASADFTLSSGELRAQTESLYDDLGRVYESRVYEVDPSTGTASDYLPSQTWYDAAGRVVKTSNGNGLFQKYAYKGQGQLLASYLSYSDEAEDYADAFDVTGDTVIEQTRYWYDEAGQTVVTATYARLPDDTTTSGELTAANSYVTAAVTWYDQVGRVVATADYGREDVNSGLIHYVFDGTTGVLIDADADEIPDVAQDTPPEPYTAQTLSSLAGLAFQLQLTQYDSAGRAYRTLDNLGRINETQYDDAGRTVRTIQNYSDGVVQETDTEQDSTVEYEYDSAGRLVTLIAYNAKGTGNGVEQQKTKYLYTSTVNASWQTAAVYPDSTDALSQDSNTKVWTITTDNGDHVATEYDHLGRTTNVTDQRGVVHAYTFDSAGRLSADTVDLSNVESGQNVDNAILRIGRTYDDLGRLEMVTSYSDTSGTTAVNQVKYRYNGWGKLAQEWQDHAGLVDPQSTPSVQYVYTDGASGGVAKYVRLSEVVYPNGRQVQYGYGTPGAIDDIMSRLATIGDSTNTYSSYKYLGAERIVTEDYEEAEVRLDYAADNFLGLDRFGRVVDQVWTDYGADPDVALDRYTYTYGRAGNRTAKVNVLHNDFSETYGYNSLDELISSVRDDSFDQSWTLDGLGNWSEFDNDGTTQTRDTNAANEITSTSGIATPAYDRAGNMTAIPKPSNPAKLLGAKYDAWNHLVEVSDGGILIAKFRYDGEGRRIEQLTDFAEGVPQNATHYFLNGQQVIETREGSPATSPESLQPKYQQVWSPRYIDSLILRDENTDTDDQCDDQRLFYLADANYNVTALVNSSGEVVERYLYDAYGKATVLNPDFTADVGNKSDFANTTLYTGRELDVTTRLYFYRARYYSAELGRFVSRDPIDYDGGINLYEYCGNAPVMRADPRGLSFLTFYDNGRGQLCGYSIWLLTGSWCANPDAVIAATDAHEKYTSCFCQCELTTHKCVAGQILTTVEVVSGPIAALGARVPKSPSFFFYGIGMPNYPTPTPGYYDTVAMWLAGWLGANRLGSNFSRLVAPTARAGVVGAALAEAGISAKCWVDCK